MPQTLSQSDIERIRLKAVSQERIRIACILALPEARPDNVLAKRLAFETRLTAEESRDALRAGKLPVDDSTANHSDSDVLTLIGQLRLSGFKHSADANQSHLSK